MVRQNANNVGTFTNRSDALTLLDERNASDMQRDKRLRKIDTEVKRKLVRFKDKLDLLKDREITREDVNIDSLEKLTSYLHDQEQIYKEKVIRADRIPKQETVQELR